MTVIHLQHIPPSTNNLYANVPRRGRVKTERYRTWLQAAGWDMKRYHNVRWNEPVYLAIVIGKLRANADVSNRVKAIEDLLVAHRIIPGDTVQWIRGVDIRLSQKQFDGVEISITPSHPVGREAA